MEAVLAGLGLIVFVIFVLWMRRTLVLPIAIRVIIGL